MADDAYLFQQLQILIWSECLGWHWCTWKHKLCLAMLYSKGLLCKCPTSDVPSTLINCRGRELLGPRKSVTWMLCGFCLLYFSNTAGCFFTIHSRYGHSHNNNKLCGGYLGLTETYSENHIPVPTTLSFLRALLTSSARTVSWGSGLYFLPSCMLQLQNWTCTT